MKCRCLANRLVLAFLIAATVLLGARTAMAEGQMSLSAAFAPTDLSNLVLWLRADGGNPRNGGSAATTGQPVTSWLDSSGLSNNGTSAGSPTLQLNGSIPVVRFAGGQRFNTSVSFSAGQQSTYLVVFSTPNSNANGRFISSSELRNMSDVGNVLNVYDGTTGRNGTTNIQNSSFHIATVRHMTSSPVDVRLDGIAESMSPGGNFNLSATSQLSIGATSTSSSAINGDIAEVLVYNRALSVSELNQVGFYLQQKYGIAGAFFDTVIPVTPEPASVLLFAGVFLMVFGWHVRRRTAAHAA